MRFNPIHSCLPMNLLAFFLCLFACASSFSTAPEPQPVQHATVFVHGTLCFEMAVLLNKKSGWHGHMSPTYLRVLHKLRSHDFLANNQALLPTCGLAELLCDDLKNFADPLFTPSHHNNGAYHLAAAYHSLQTLLGDPADQHHYFVFGHFGLLSYDYRLSAACDLYQQLVALRKRLGDNCVITVVCHSHGGNVGLLLAEAERIYRQGLVIETLVNYASPVHRETAALIPSPVFKTVVHIQSEGDLLAVSDIISTKHHRCHRYLGSVLNKKTGITPRPDQRVYDIRLLINHKRGLISHKAIWFLGERPRSLGLLKDLPICALTPIILDELHRQCPDVPYQKIDLDFQVRRTSATFSCRPYGKRCTPCTTEQPKNWYETIKELGNSAIQYWKRHPQMNQVFFNIKTMTAFKILVAG